jgi:capsular polysaccharide biosynthesis protein
MEIFPETYRLFAAEKKPYRKIFLNRKSFFQRNIKNIKRIEEILQGKGFEMIYAEDLSYEKQVELFREVKYFVGIHGAGLTNLLHSKIDELYVLEIFSESLVHASFYRFLEMLHIKYYDAIVGSAFDINWNFTIDENKFRERVELMLSAGEA